MGVFNARYVHSRTAVLTTHTAYVISIKLKHHVTITAIVTTTTTTTHLCHVSACSLVKNTHGRSYAATPSQPIVTTTMRKILLPEYILLILLSEYSAVKHAAAHTHANITPQRTLYTAPLSPTSHTPTNAVPRVTHATVPITTPTMYPPPLPLHCSPLTIPYHTRSLLAPAQHLRVVTAVRQQPCEPLSRSRHHVHILNDLSVASNHPNGEHALLYTGLQQKWLV